MGRFCMTVTLKLWLEQLRLVMKNSSQKVYLVYVQESQFKPYLNGMSQAELIRHFEETLTDQVYELTKADVKEILKNWLKNTKKKIGFIKNNLLIQRFLKKEFKVA
jgi:lipoate---protein ligase